MTAPKEFYDLLNQYEATIDKYETLIELVVSDNILYTHTRNNKQLKSINSKSVRVLNSNLKQAIKDRDALKALIHEIEGL
jgi:hypothetical protein